MTSKYFQNGDTLSGPSGPGKDINVLVPDPGKILGGTLAGTIVTPISITLGSGTTLVAGNTLETGSVTSVITNAAPFLNSGTIVGAGTITAATVAAHSVLANPGGAGAVPVAAPISSNLSFSSGTLGLADNINIAQNITAGINVISAGVVADAATVSKVTSTGTLKVGAFTPFSAMDTGSFVVNFGTLSTTTSPGYADSIVAQGSSIAFTSGTIANMTSLVLPTGTWDVSAQIQLTGAGATTITGVQASISNSSTVLSSTAGMFNNANFGGVSLTTFGADPTINIIGGAPVGTGTYYATIKAGFAVGTLGTYGILQARRR